MESSIFKVYVIEYGKNVTKEAFIKLLKFKIIEKT